LSNAQDRIQTPYGPHAVSLSQAYFTDVLKARGGTCRGFLVERKLISSLEKGEHEMGFKDFCKNFMTMPGMQARYSGWCKENKRDPKDQNENFGEFFFDNYVFDDIADPGTVIVKDWLDKFVKAKKSFK
jgi:hypothetical protein